MTNVAAIGFSGSPFERALFDVLVFNPYALSTHQPLIAKARPTMLAFRLYSRYIIIYGIYIFVSMGRPFGPAWAPRNAQRANVGPAGLGSMVNVIALKTATLVLSRG